MYLIAACAYVLALIYAPVQAQTTSNDSGSGDDNDEDWKKVAIIVPIVFSGVALLITLLYCCCCRSPAYGQGAGSWWDCGNCWNCRGCGCDGGNCNGCGCNDGYCCGCDCRGCGDCRNCGCDGGMCRGCGDCRVCGCDCRGCGCDGCCPADDGRYYSNQMVYSSSQGPVITGPPVPAVVRESAYVYGSSPPQDNRGYTSPYTNVSSIPVNNHGPYGGIRSGGGYGGNSYGWAPPPRPVGGSPYSGGCGCG